MGLFLANFQIGSLKLHAGPTFVVGGQRNTREEGVGAAPYQYTWAAGGGRTWRAARARRMAAGAASNVFDLYCTLWPRSHPYSRIGSTHRFSGPCARGRKRKFIVA